MSKENVISSVIKKYHEFNPDWNGVPKKELLAEYIFNFTIQSPPFSFEQFKFAVDYLQNNSK